MTDLKSLTYPQLQEFIKELGQPAFRAGQVFDWLHNKRVTSFDQMTNLPAALRQTLADRCSLNSLTIERKLVSQKDGTVKYLFGLQDGECVESVLMDYHHGHSLCISTQVGCRQGCRFCASTLGGLVRNLTPAEMLDEIYTATADSGHRIDSVVLMGIGEPLDNFDNVMAFLELLSDPRGLNLSLRHVSLSTCGLVDRIYDLAEKKLGLTLSISLHGSNNAVRSASMPINNKWNIESLLKACRDYFDTTGRRVSFEYALIEGKNDSPAQAKELAALLKGMLCHVNLIPVNPVVERGNRRSSRQAVERFQKTLQACGV
ncbi:MAG: 23S rRNA (adenine(2503)-C(2))-methyltransferase RlmN, partial [Oscillospiraceae bacterium]|nr:23S rRNA (adenine(2503)-C(2))-methyltransferase RlmN [Oscillospiraceae bacterium]